ncbi:hypothetical protein [Bradyrhizobium valentinum]|uniref:Uncharacterized protein n=1 Tax=Bradyrhizobium valentinum TaxID=1518501 RepID=A0A0R3M4L9_9BRAD|nr:hypothetical protein [Bradyrhizobium valentinum]KRR15001.1 hypothetical protein CP49_23605 [Bradyrhizobium valentinum]
MQVGRDDTIAGLRLMHVRDFLRWAGDNSVRPDAIDEYFKVDPARAREIEQALLDAGYLEKEEAKFTNESGTWYVAGGLGRQLCNAKFVRRITRDEAEKLVVSFLERVKGVNERDELTHRVEEVRVFGSYLGGKSDLGDVDLAVAFEPRRPTHVEESLLRAEQSGKRINNYLGRLFYGQHEVKKLLKHRSPYLSIHEVGELEKLGTNFKVLFRRQAESNDCA